MRLSLGRKNGASSSGSREGNQRMTEQEETAIRSEPGQSIITISPLEDVVTTVISVSRTPSQNIFDAPQILPPPPAVISESNLSTSSMSSSQNHLNVMTQIQQNSISSNINQVDQSISHTSATPFRCSRHSKLTIQTLLALSLIVTIGIYTVLIMKLESDLPIFVHVIFVFIIVVEISFIERWYTAQRADNEWRQNGANGRLWAPWNDPEFHRRTSPQHLRAAVFDPECPRDFIPPPAYGNLRDSVMIDPNTGRISHLETSQITNVDEDVTEIPPNYDALSVRSSRMSARTTEQNENTSYDDSQDGVNV